ncbi:hypothetical protein NCAS_0A14370 [Naumovozyma castellii]|uniref:Ubiquitin carboxyl-terminal hydrolase n=1 Tax=Naumovozyma castellii TaxID=27288 RepID=G0V945_NAUCA|nr:hypothetical protein NCAS_0A14370 [Naumovozyma castellii CBS 4309]CCC67995.1 hypothetical protein NCAS_0A14370 [Naumovozyma castellii CBS 4309]
MLKRLLSVKKTNTTSNTKKYQSEEDVSDHHHNHYSHHHHHPYSLHHSSQHTEQKNNYSGTENNTPTVTHHTEPLPKVTEQISQPTRKVQPLMQELHANDPHNRSSIISDPIVEMESPILFTPMNQLLPYGDGSNKVFGYENFGNTCYCNSVLQCLYNLTELRLNLLEYPARDPKTRIRKLDMDGEKPRLFTEESFEPLPPSSQNNINNHLNSPTFMNESQKKDILERQNRERRLMNKEKEKEKEPRKNSFMGFQVPSGKQSGKEKEQGNDSEPEKPEITHANLMTSDMMTEKLHEGCQEILVGRIHESTTTPQSPRFREVQYPEENDLSNNKILPERQQQGNNQIKQSTHTSEKRKKAALLQGPIVNVDHIINPSEKVSLYETLRELFECITENKSLTGVVSPVEFVKVLKKENILFNSMMQQDAHEFLNFLLNELSEYLQNHISHPSNKPTDIPFKNYVIDLFQGVLTNRIKCLTCDNITSRDEPFLDFPIGVKGDENIDIQDVLRCYHTREMLNGSNKFYCSQCCGLQEAERIVGLKQLPHTLALHLKRFKYSEEQNTNIKLFNKVQYPLKLDVASTFDSSIAKKYELTGVVIHMGGSPQHGHYVSLCKNDKFGWLLFDDETVESVTEKTVLEFTGDSSNQATAYVLFYKELDEKDTKPVDYQTNIDELVRYDDWYRERLRKTFKLMHDEPITRDTHPVKAQHSNDVSPESKEKDKSKRKSRILGFI